MSKIKVIVADDSAFMRKAISNILSEDPEIEVIGTARNGLDVLEKVKRLNPDVLTLDINMPVMDGRECLKLLMEQKPIPVVLVSSLTERDAPLTLELLDMGAFDFVLKPSGTVSLDIRKVGREIVEKVKNAARMKVRSSLKRKLYSHHHKVISDEVRFCVAIGISTGGPKTLIDILEKIIPDPNTCYLVAQHMPYQFTVSLAQRLSKITPIPFQLAENGLIVKGARGYLAPGGYNMSVTLDKRLRVSKFPDTTFKPCVDILFESVADVFGEKSIGVILTGIGDDGAKGLLKMFKKGAVTIAESEETAVVYGMPRAAKEIGAVRIIAPCYQISNRIVFELNKLKRGIKWKKRRF